MGSPEALTVQLPCHRVDVVEPGVSVRRYWLKCEIGEDLKFDTAGLEAYCLAGWDVRVYDAFVLAAAVQFCDHTKARSSVGWGRNIALRVPVHELDHWSTEKVSGSLHEALTFLTGDRWKVTFYPRKTSASPPRQRRFTIPDGSRVVIPFSDGLDSLAVSGLAERQHGHKLIRVRLGSRSLNGYRAGSKHIPFAVVPYRVRYGQSRSVETSGRSRGFKFALLSGIAAYLSKAKQVIVAESGQGALGPALVPVGQAYEDYRNHPLFTDRMVALLSALFGHEVRYVYPRLWNTKAETISKFIEDCRNGEDWEQTRSCWQGPRQVSVSGQMRQCGVCAACMLRRMTVHAICRTEKIETYVWENLRAPNFEGGAAHAFKIRKPRGAFYEYAIAGTLHLDHLSDLLHSSASRVLLERQVFQLSRSLKLSKKETQTRLERLLKQHAKEWKNFVDSLGSRSFVAQWTMGRP